MPPILRSLSLLFLSALLPAAVLSAAPAAKPKVRAITGFVTIDPKNYPEQLTETVQFLRKISEAVKAAGYDVAGIRISTQPFPEYTKGLSRADALKRLRDINAVSQQIQGNFAHYQTVGQHYLGMQPGLRFI